MFYCSPMAIFLLLWGVKAHTELMEGNTVARRNQINERTFSSSTYCLSYQSRQFGRDNLESP